MGKLCVILNNVSTNLFDRGFTRDDLRHGEQGHWVPGGWVSGVQIRLVRRMKKFNQMENCNEITKQFAFTRKCAD